MLWCMYLSRIKGRECVQCGPSLGRWLFPFHQGCFAITLFIHFPLIEHSNLTNTGQLLRNTLKVDRSSEAHRRAFSGKPSYACGSPRPHFSPCGRKNPLHGAFTVQRPIRPDRGPVRAQHGGFDTEDGPANLEGCLHFGASAFRRQHPLTRHLALQFPQLFPEHSSLLLVILSVCRAPLYHARPPASKKKY